MAEQEKTSIISAVVQLCGMDCVSDRMDQKCSLCI